MRTRSLAFAALAVLAGCGGPLLFAELEIPSVTVTLPSQSFPATTAGPGNQCPAPDASPNCIYQTFSYDLGSQVSILTEKNVTSQIRLTNLAIALTATGALQDFGSIRAVTIRVLPPQGSSLPAVVVASYTRNPAQPTPHDIAVSGYSNVDLAPYLESGQLSVAAQMSFDAGTPDFSADVTGDFYLKVKLDYGAYAGL